MFEDFLEYQNLHRELRKLKREIAANPSKAEQEKLSQAIRASQSKIVELDAEAGKLLKDFEKSKKDYNLLVDRINEIKSKDAKTLSADEINATISKLNNLVGQLSSMERVLSSQAEGISSIVKSFDTNKNVIKNSKPKYAQVKEEVEQFESKLMPEVEKIKKQMAAMEPKLDPKMLSHYKSLCQENAWPVFVPLTNGACGGCTMGLSAALLNKVKADGYIECEQCRRYIYNTEK